MLNADDDDDDYWYIGCLLKYSAILVDSFLQQKLFYLEKVTPDELYIVIPGRYSGSLSIYCEMGVAAAQLDLRILILILIQGRGLLLIAFKEVKNFFL